MCCCLVLQVSGKCRSSRNWASYSSSHKDWSCWAGLHPPSKADAVYAIPSRAPRLRVHQTGSRGGAEARRARAGLARSVRRGCTRRWKRALHVPPRGGAVGGTACRAPTPVAGSGRLAQRGRPGRGSTYLRTAINPVSRIAVGLKPSAMQNKARLRGLDRIIDSKDHFSRSHRADRRNGRGGAIPSPSIISRRAGPDCPHTKIAAASAT